MLGERSFLNFNPDKTYAVQTKTQPGLAFFNAGACHPKGRYGYAPDFLTAAERRKKQ